MIHTQRYNKVYFPCQEELWLAIAGPLFIIISCVVGKMLVAGLVQFIVKQNKIGCKIKNIAIFLTCIFYLRVNDKDCFTMRF